MIDIPKAKQYYGTAPCPYNEGVTCGWGGFHLSTEPPDECHKCGWYPPEAERRMEESRRGK